MTFQKNGKGNLQECGKKVHFKNSNKPDMLNTNGNNFYRSIKNEDRNNYNKNIPAYKKKRGINQNVKLPQGFYIPIKYPVNGGVTFELPHYAEVITNNNGVPVSNIQQINKQFNHSITTSGSPGNGQIFYEYPTLQTLLTSGNINSKGSNKKFNKNINNFSPIQPYLSYGIQNTFNRQLSRTPISTLHFQAENSNHLETIGFIHHPVPIFQNISLDQKILEHEHSIRQQIEYYFSEDNLIKDLFFRRLILNPCTRGFVSIYQLLSFHRLYRLISHYPNPVAEIARIISTSETVEVSSDGLMLRAKNNLHIKYAQMALSK
uniref:HTH La-type RNA-binding domain-containing protein n=1 Tax=Parastrongyloides trichosuri TaxID=131310 RepID=A0A0N4ZC91_PARTI